MLDKIFGTKSAEMVLLHLFHYGEVYARGISKDTGISLSAIQNQFKKFEDAGVIVSKLMGNTRIYTFNLKSPLTKPLMEMIKVVHSNMSIQDKEHIFHQRKRPRRTNKPVKGRVNS